MPKHPTHYSDYLKLDPLLKSQVPLSQTCDTDSHDEMLFIIVHQAHELWFKQILLEIDGVISLLSTPYLNDKKLLKLSRRLHRVHVIQKILLEQLNALSTLSPMEFLEFRDALTPASGFQSLQFRLLEIKLGIQKKQITHNLNEQEANTIKTAEKGNTLFQQINQWLERMPFLQNDNFIFWRSYQMKVRQMLENDKKELHVNTFFTDEDKIQRLKEIDSLQAYFDLFFKQDTYKTLIDRKERRMSFKASQSALFIFLYRDQSALQLPFQILSNLIQLGENLNSWRAKHLQLVQRLIGAKMGAGGSSGIKYLAQGLHTQIFSDLTSLSTFMLPQSLLPKLPKEIKKNLGSFYESSSD